MLQLEEATKKKESTDVMEKTDRQTDQQRGSEWKIKTPQINIE